MLNITHETGQFLSVIIRSKRAKRILELGTSNGYSTLWLAEATHSIGGTVTTVELLEDKVSMATKNFQRAGLADVISQVRGEAGLFLESERDAEYDLIFLDSERSQYRTWWPSIRRILKSGGLIIADNAVSHANELVPFVSVVEADNFVTSLVPVGKGEFLATQY